MIRVLVVDDSALVRKLLTETLSSYSGIEVVGSAVDPYVARDKIARLRPDVITLDIEMPRMNGLEFLAALMAHHPLPVVVVSSITPADSEAALQALALGAVEVICKPGPAYSTPDIGRDLVRAIRAAAGARPKARTAESVPLRRDPTLARFATTDRVLAIGASTGGTVAIESLLMALPADAPGTVIVQHMPPQFTGAFAARLDRLCAVEVREARDGDAIVTGVVLIAPGDRHMVVQGSGARRQVRIKDGPRICHQRPSVDVLFDSVARTAGRNAVGVLLTGMGADGAKGMLAMRQAGATTLAQDEASCVVFGMPREAVLMGGVDRVVSLTAMSAAIDEALRTPARATA